jgi:hypothetical protein
MRCRSFRSGCFCQFGGASAPLIFAVILCCRCSNAGSFVTMATGAAIYFGRSKQSPFRKFPTKGPGDEEREPNVNFSAFVASESSRGWAVPARDATRPWPPLSPRAH